MINKNFAHNKIELITTGSYQTIDLNCFAVDRVLNKKERVEPYVL